LKHQPAGEKITCVNEIKMIVALKRIFVTAIKQKLKDICRDKFHLLCCKWLTII
jgi:hypothetical protein